MDLFRRGSKTSDSSGPADGPRISALSIERLTPTLVSWGYHLDNTADRGPLRLLSQAIVRSGATHVLDIGASSGGVAETILGKGVEKLAALEPNTQFFEALEALARSSKGVFEWAGMAAGEKDGYTNLRYNPGIPEGGMTSSVEGAGESMVTNALSKRVDRLAVDDYVQRIGWQPNLIVVDTPGSSDKILRGMSVTIGNSALSAAIVAVLPVPGRSESSLVSIAGHFPGFDAYRVLPNKGGVVKIATHDPFANLPFASHILFARKSATNLRLNDYTAS